MTQAQRGPELFKGTRLKEGAALLEEVPGAILLLDVVGIVRYMNRIAEHRIDQARADTVGRDLFREIFPHLEREGVGERYRAAMRVHPGALGWETSISASTGERRVSFVARSYQGDGGRLGVVLVEDRSALAFEAARRIHAERLAAVGELAAGVAHEINNPLASIKAFAQLLARETLDRGQQQALEVISQECTRVARIVDNLLDFASQQRVAEREGVNVSEIADRILSLRRYSLETSGVQVDVDLDMNVSIVEGEKGAIQRLVLILLGQAERSVNRREGDRRLYIRTRESNEGVVLYVGDNGPGVPRDRLASSLDPGGEPEAGLGLSSADAIARDHGGILWVESADGKGTTYTVRLPRGREGTVATPVAQSAEEPSASPRAPRVLIADDEPTLRLALSMFLGRQGYEVEQAEDADQALRMASANEYDVALIDVRMPGDGLSLIDRLDEFPAWRGRAILMTGDQTHSRVRAEIRNGRPHLTKPFDMMDAVRLIEAVTERAGLAEK